MTHEEMWNAVLEKDASYDGIFFYGVKSTGIYCRPSCKSKKPKQVNITYFDTGKQAREAGFRPCKRCRSDLFEYEPIKEIAQKAKRLLEDSFQKRSELNRELDQLGVSQHRMAEIFKAEYGVTLYEYACGLRLKEAKRLLADSDKDIIEIAYSTGFNSLSSFYRFFKNRAGAAPAVYRKESRK